MSKGTQQTLLVDIIFIWSEQLPPLVFSHELHFLLLLKDVSHVLLPCLFDLISMEKWLLVGINTSLDDILVNETLILVLKQFLSILSICQLIISLTILNLHHLLTVKQVFFIAMQFIRSCWSLFPLLYAVSAFTTKMHGMVFDRWLKEKM